MKSTTIVYHYYRKLVNYKGNETSINIFAQ